jgi:hypothetical protein
VLIDLLSWALFLPTVKVSRNVLPCQHRAGLAIEAVKIPLSGSVAGFTGDIVCSTFTTSSSKPLPFRFDGCATSISLTEAAGPVSGSGCNTNP